MCYNSIVFEPGLPNHILCKPNLFEHILFDPNLFEPVCSNPSIFKSQLESFGSGYTERFKLCFCPRQRSGWIRNRYF